MVPKDVFGRRALATRGLSVALTICRDPSPLRSEFNSMSVPVGFFDEAVMSMLFPEYVRFLLLA
jgi:hypothetical protein